MLVMNATNNLRNLIINKLLTITNEEYLTALYHLIDKSVVNEDVVELSELQILMLNMSEEDMKNHRFLSQEELDKKDLEWLKSL
jgi:hypothetical protein